MCGIAGMIGMEPNPMVCQRMLDSMRHRGPDDSGMYIHRDCTLLHARLSVIDPDGGRQPMVLERGEERYILVYNGELYNTEEIRKELAQLGCVFRGHSDTEVVLYAYVQWGRGCLERLNGIFAFAVWEEHRRRLFLARDRIGVKPLFYRAFADCLLFASEIKTILAHPEVDAVLDETGAAEIVLLGPGRTPGSGVFRGISELEPGCCGYFQQGHLEVIRYWQLRDGIHTDSLEDTLAKVRYLVEDAVKRQLVSDVPIGTFLSGGLDSSLICAISAEMLSAEQKRLPTFSVDYQDNDTFFVPGKFQPESDTEYIRLMTDYLDSEHHWSVLTPEQLVDALEAATIARDLPGMADVDFSLLAFCSDIRKEVTVALSGECADEIFGGYPWYRDPDVRSWQGFPWAQNTGQRVSLTSSVLRKRISAEEFIGDHYAKTCAESDILPENSPLERRMKEMMNLNFRWFMQTLLDRKDRMSMYSSLEVRVPFCDYRIAEYLYTVPWEIKDYGGVEKGLLRKAMSGRIPNRILWRKKSPYPKTFNPRYRSRIEELYRTLLSDQNAPLWYMLDRREAANLLTSEPLWPWYGQLMRGTQTMAYLLQVDFWLRHYGIQFAL